MKINLKIPFNVKELRDLFNNDELIDVNNRPIIYFTLEQYNYYESLLRPEEKVYWDGDKYLLCFNRKIKIIK